MTSSDNAFVGTVINYDTRLPLPGVTVTATSPSLPDARVVQTNPGGEYYISELPSGTYALEFECPGFETEGAENIPLQFGRTVPVSAQMAPVSA